MVFQCRDPCRSCLRECLESQRVSGLMSCFRRQVSTKWNADLLLEAIRSRALSGVCSGLCASRRNRDLFVITLDGFSRLLPVQFQNVFKRLRQSLHEFLFRSLLGIHTWDFFNPSHPPIAIFLSDRRETCFHCDSMFQASDVDKGVFSRRVEG